MKLLHLYNLKIFLKNHILYWKWQLNIQYLSNYFNYIYLIFGIHFQLCTQHTESLFQFINILRTVNNDLMDI